MMTARRPWRLAAALVAAVMILTSSASVALAGPTAPAAVDDAGTRETTEGGAAETPETPPLARNDWGFTLHPRDQSVAPGYDVEFTVSFDTPGTTLPSTGHWQRSTDGGVTWTNVVTETWTPGSTRSLTVPAVTSEEDGYLYRARVVHRSLVMGDRVSNPARLTVLPPSARFNQQPVGVAVREGDVAEITASYVVTPIGRGQRTTEVSRDGGRSWVQVESGGWVSTASSQATGTMYLPRWSSTVWSSDDGLLVRFGVWFEGQLLVHSEAAEVTVETVRPVVTEAPVDVSVAAGGSASFSAAYGGTDAPTSVQWQFSTDGGQTFTYVPAGIGPNGAQSVPLVIDPVREEMDGWQYRVRFTNEAGSAWSDAATLRVGIWWPDAAGEAAPGERVEVRAYDPARGRQGVMHVTAPTGTRIVGSRTNGGDLWFAISEDGRTAVSNRQANPWGGGGPSAWFTLEVDPDVAPGSVLDDGEFRIVQGDVLRAQGAVAVTVVQAAPVASEHPADREVPEGGRATFAAGYSGTQSPVSVQWQSSRDGGATWADVPGADELTLVVEEARLDMDGTLFRAVFSNEAGSDVSRAAALSVTVVRPQVVEAPVDVVAVAGQSASFSAAYGGTDALVSVQWQFSTDGGQTFGYVPAGIGPNGAQSVPLVIDPVGEEMDGWLYRVRFTNEAGSAWSDAATLTVRTPPSLTTQPRDQSVPEGVTATFSAGAQGTSLGWARQWQVSTDGGGSWADVPGATQVSYTTPEATLAMSGWRYRIVFANVAGSTTSEAATLTVTPVAPVASEHPADREVPEGGRATFAAGYSGTASPVSVQWQSSRDGGASWADVPGADELTLVVEEARLDMDGTLFRAVFSNEAGSDVSRAAALSVTVVPPQVVQAPAGVAVMEGESASFSAAYSGTDAPVSVQWQFSTDGGETFTDVPAGVGPNGAQSVPLVIDPVREEMDGWLYRVRFTNEAGSVWSDAATLRVGIWWRDAAGDALPGERVEVRAYDLDRPRPGVMHVTAPTGTRIVGSRTNGANLSFAISEDGRTAVSSRSVSPWGGAYPSAWFTLEVDPDVAPGSVLDDGEFRIEQGEVVRARGAVAVTVAGIAPVVVEQPADAAVFLGEPATLRVAADGTGPFTVDWQWRTGPDGQWQPWDGDGGADQPRWAIEVALGDLGEDGRQYRAVVHNAWGSAASEPATVSVRQVRPAQLTVTPRAVLVDALPAAR